VASSIQRPKIPPNGAWSESSGYLFISRRATAALLTLAAGGADDHLQDGSGYIQGPAHLNARRPQPSLTEPQLRAELTVSSCVSADGHDSDWFPVLSGLDRVVQWPPTSSIGWCRSSVVRMSVSDRRTFPSLRSICSGCVTTYVGITSARSAN